MGLGSRNGSREMACKARMLQLDLSSLETLQVYNGEEKQKDHHMVRNRRQWVIGILFWIVFLASIWLGLEGRYEWMDKAWAFVRLGILAAVSILMVVAFDRARKSPREYFFDRGVPRLVASFFMDDEDLEKRRINFKVSG
jgi:hypothetical protein